MDWEQVLINFGVVVGFLALIIFWIGLSMWMRVDADKHGIIGWVWVFVGLLTGPLGLIAYLFYRGNRPVLPVVRQRDELIHKTARAHAPVDYNPDPPAESQPTTSSDIQAALEAEERAYGRPDRDNAPRPHEI